jgi:hypothetical protein
MLLRCTSVALSCTATLNLPVSFLKSLGHSVATSITSWLLGHVPVAQDVNSTFRFGKASIEKDG